MDVHKPASDIPDELERRMFLKVAGLGMLTFTVGDAMVGLTARQARAQGIPLRILDAQEAAAIEALGETLVPGARESGVAHFIDHQISRPPEEALLEARTVNVQPPFANFYRAAVAAIDKASDARHGHGFAATPAKEQAELVGLLRQNKLEGWQGPPQGLVYFVLRSDAADVVYGTMEGYAALGVPYQPHIAPEIKW
jgi:hypothetical protein